MDLIDSVMFCGISWFCVTKIFHPVWLNQVDNIKSMFQSQSATQLQERLLIKRKKRVLTIYKMKHLKSNLTCN